MKYHFLCLLSVCLMIAPNVLSSASQSYSFGPSKKIEFDVPEGWTSEVQGKEAPGGEAVEFIPAGDVPLKLLVTPYFIPGDSERLSHAVQSSVARSTRRLGEFAAEDHMPVCEFEGIHCRVLYVSATDRTVEKPSLKDFKYVDQGAAAVGKLMIRFTY